MQWWDNCSNFKTMDFMHLKLAGLLFLQRGFSGRFLFILFTHIGISFVQAGFSTSQTSFFDLFFFLIFIVSIIYFLYSIPIKNTAIVC